MKYIKIDPADNVAVALTDLVKGETVEGITLLTDIPRGHKIVLKDLAAGENVIKYGFPIGHVIADAPAGSIVDHTCIKTNLEGLLDYRYEPALVEIPEAAEKRTFMGFRRSDGQVGIRNQIWVIPTVGCVNGTALQIADRFRAEIAGREGNVDAVVAFPHNYGCSQLGRTTRTPGRFSPIWCIIPMPAAYWS